MQRSGFPVRSRNLRYGGHTPLNVLTEEGDRCDQGRVRLDWQRYVESKAGVICSRSARMLCASADALCGLLSEFDFYGRSDPLVFIEFGLALRLETRTHFAVVVGSIR